MSIKKFKLINCPEFNSIFIKNVNNITLYSIAISFTYKSNLIIITDMLAGEISRIESKPEDVNFLINYISKKIFDNIKGSYKTPNFDEDTFLDAFVIAVKEREKVKGTIKKTDIFRFETIKKLKHQGFLCNCIPGFYPETKFFLLPDGRIKDSRTNNKILFEQEQKIWDYLYRNQDRVGKEIIPSVFDYCTGRKIDIEVNGLMEKAIITYITDLKNGNYQIKINYQGQYKTINKTFTKDELIQRVIQSR
ncbi:hypothetical protein CRV08_09450 [Halarcobacter ebronensis]|uniref:Uncharacterized protein n=1 Tax=Halarcobacter ebronensis TaxID=1462615 RepID=A0A4Q0YD74_9BACT|nr:hypothetical protein [Halarcobacter ebronensis]RXJ68023.1 hypothetical protein CRV08_09450 [Halarcobacter ebronensis]